MAYIGKQPTPVPLSASDLDDDIITLAKMAAGTDGNLISYDASGNPVAISTGSDGEVLTSAGAGNPPAFEAVAAGGDLSFGGDTFGADKVIGANDAYALSLETSGNVAIKMDALGHVSQPLTPAFLALPSGTTTWNMQQQAALPFPTEIFDQNGDYNTSTYKFTAPITGRYSLTGTFDTQNLDSSASWWNLALATSNRGYGQAGNTTMFSSDLSYYGMGLAAIADMDANDTAFFQFYQANGANQIKMGVFGGGHFAGFLLA